MGVEFFFEFAYSKYKEFVEERLRWQHLNDSMSLLLRAKGYEKAPLYNDTITKFDSSETKKQDNKTDEEIIDNVLNLFKE